MWKIYCHRPVNALITKLLHLGMQHRHIAISDNPFRMFFKCCEVEFIDDANGSVAAPNAQNRIDVISVEIILQHVGTKVIIACKLVIFSEQAVVVNSHKAFFFNPFHGNCNLIAPNLPRRRHQRNLRAFFQKIRSFHRCKDNTF